jgi:hypothetical protein
MDSAFQFFPANILQGLKAWALLPIWRRISLRLEKIMRQGIARDSPEKL